MYTFGYNQPNFKTSGSGVGFVSYCRPEDRRCTAFWIIMTVSRLVKEGKASELLEMEGSLSSEFGEGGRSSGYLSTETLDRLSWTLGTYDTPCRVSVSQAYELAELAVALLNYDVNHADDDTPILCTVEEREVVIGMIELVHAAADRSTLTEALLEADTYKLRAKYIDRYAASTRP